MAYPITKDLIMKECVRQGYYRTPSCNEKLYLHHKGYDRVEPHALDEYTDVKVLWLEGNCFSSFPCGATAAAQGEPDIFVSQYPTVRQLYLHGNTLALMPDLSQFKNLDAVNLSDNFITKVDAHCEHWEKRKADVEALEAAPMSPPSKSATPEQIKAAERDALNKKIREWSQVCQHAAGDECPCGTLRTLQLKNNHLKTPESLARLLCYRSVSVLDLSGNRIEDGESLLQILERMDELKSLYLTGNPCVRAIPNYRRTMISRCKKLLYLDDRPVFDEERRLVTAWAAGGNDAEKKEKLRMKEEEDAKFHKRLADFRELMAAARRSAGEKPDEEQTTEEEDDSNPTESSSNNGGEEAAAPSADPSAIEAAPAAGTRTAFYQQNYANKPVEGDRRVLTSNSRAASDDAPNEVQWGNFRLTRKEDASKATAPAAAAPAPAASAEAKVDEAAVAATATAAPRERHVDPAATTVAAAPAEADDNADDEVAVWVPGA